MTKGFLLDVFVEATLFGVGLKNESTIWRALL